MCYELAPDGACVGAGAGGGGGGAGGCVVGIGFIIRFLRHEHISSPHTVI